MTLVDGEQHDFWRVDPDRLRKALTGSAAALAPGTPLERDSRHVC